jgi:cbb3-type cytochrome oxidase subunit 3
MIPALRQLPIPQRTLWMLMVLLGLSIAIVLLVYLPSQKERAELERGLAQLRDENRAQQILMPLRVQLERAEAAETEFEVMMRSLEPALEVMSVDGASQMLTALAARHALAGASFTPIPTSLLAQRGELLVEGRMIGSLQHFRDFLLVVLASPAVLGLELIEIQSRDGRPEFRVRIWLSVA